jgi:hypothetical protein
MQNKDLFPNCHKRRQLIGRCSLIDFLVGCVLLATFSFLGSLVIECACHLMEVSTPVRVLSGILSSFFVCFGAFVLVAARLHDLGRSTLLFFVTHPFLYLSPSEAAENKYGPPRIILRRCGARVLFVMLSLVHWAIGFILLAVELLGADSIFGTYLDRVLGMLWLPAALVGDAYVALFPNTDLTPRGLSFVLLMVFYSLGSSALLCFWIPGFIRRRLR